MNERIIHTNLYSNIAKEVLQSVVGQLSDGIWENSTSAEKYWRFCNVETAPNGEVLIKINGEEWKWYATCRRHNGFYDMSDVDVIRWFAGKVKQIMHVELNDNNIAGGWMRNNDQFETEYLSYKEKITVSDVYIIYETLLNRHLFGKYDAIKIGKILGTPKSEADTKAEEIRRAKLEAIDFDWNNECKKLEIWKGLQIKGIESQYLSKLEELRIAFKAKREALKA